MITNPLWILLFSFLLAGVPVFISLGTAYIKVSIVLSMIRNGLGTQNIPGTLVTTALSLTITGIVMGPVISKTVLAVEQTEIAKIPDPIELLKSEKLITILKPWKGFLFQHTGDRELRVFQKFNPQYAQSSEMQTEAWNVETVPLDALIPAFVVSELKEAFAMAFALLLPFLVIDVVVSNILVGLGMFMVSPVLISLPLKLVVFVLSDGWLLLVHGLIASYRLVS